MTPAQQAHIMSLVEAYADSTHISSHENCLAARAAVEAALRDAPQAEGWRAHVEQRIRTWRQSTMNKSGDRLAIDDFMEQDSIDDLVDFVCDEYAFPSAPTAVEPDAPLKWCSYCGEGVTTFCRGKQSPDWDYKCPVLNLPARASKGTP